MHGFDEEWLASHEKRMAKLRSPIKAVRASVVVVKKAKRKASDYTHIKRGVRLDIGPMCFRSSWEANIARYFNLLIMWGKITKWEYEKTEFKFNGIERGTRFYLVDFKVFPVGKEPYYVEVKGRWTSKARTQIKRMRVYHPNVVIEIIDKRAYYAIAEKVRKLIPMWEGASDPYV